MEDLFLYDPGVPRYLGQWLVGLPILAAGLALLRVRFKIIAVIGLATIPSLLTTRPPWWVNIDLGLPLGWWLLNLVVVTLVIWLVVTVRKAKPDNSPPTEIPWTPLFLIAFLSLAFRVPLTWIDPGISDIPVATETAIGQLLEGVNPYTVPNPNTLTGKYPYPAGTLLINLPFVAILPDSILGEAHLGVRATMWALEAAAVVILGIAGAGAGHPRAGLASAYAYAASPMLWNEGGMTLANDLVVGLLAAVSATVLAKERPLLAGLAVGLAIAVKPAALVLLPLVVLAAGLRGLGAAVALPLALQAPFLLWPYPGLRGLDAVLEPVTRLGPLHLQATSIWWPLYQPAGGSPNVAKLTAAAGIAVALVGAIWAGAVLRRRPITLSRSAAAFALPLLLAYALASRRAVNYQDWYLAAFLLAAGLEGAPYVKGPQRSS